MNLIILFIAISYHAIKFSAAKTLKIGIIGGGIGGTATAYYIRQLLDQKADVTVFEAREVGGRLSTRKVGNHQYEVGGAVAIQRNRYIWSLLDELGLKIRGEPPAGYSALYDGETVLFAENEWRALTVAELMWRYRTGLYYINQAVDQRLDLFDRIYEHQSELLGFENVTALVESMSPGFVQDLTVTTEKGFQDDGFSSVVIDELVAATLRVNYGQHLKVHKFVGAVSVAGVGKTCFAVEGGNFKVAKKLLVKSQAKLVTETVKQVVRLPSGRIRVVTAPRSDIPPDGVEYMEFDNVVIAAPQTSDMANRIEFKGFKSPISFSGMYHRTVCTLLRSAALRTDQFLGAHSYTDEVLTTRPGLMFNSISRVYPVETEGHNRTSDVWKVFSQQPLTAAQLSEYFETPHDIVVTDWLAYPDYDTRARHDTFVLSDGLYHVNAIEWAASAMEMSLISAKNIAILVRNRWCQKEDCPDHQGRINQHTEL